ncbi:hypothetical protein [Methyloglobulus sp.]|uniref:hypothetical protein n=1 Tax=Methyloglobulus sp. TaxID=2518622 RepID=UPI0032B78728
MPKTQSCPSQCSYFLQNSSRRSNDFGEAWRRQALELTENDYGYVCHLNVQGYGRCKGLLLGKHLKAITSSPVTGL